MALNYTPTSLGNLSNETQFLNELNTNFSELAALLEDVLSRSGEGPNTWGADQDANGYSLNNIGEITATDVYIDGKSLAEQMATAVQSAEDAADEAEGHEEAAQLAAVAAQGAANTAAGFADAAEAAYQNILFLDVVTETGSFTIDDTYTNKMVIVDSGSGVTCTIGGSSVGCQVLVVQGGAGAITFSSSDTILTRDGLTTNGEGAVASVIQYAESAVYLNGQLG